ncbi:hypothetical protein KM295_14220 [Natronomonas sp. F2-12]|uniref:Uncharacterized protein n=1 Tax=Natronomonas aquatica TaxID=2841590 RepID=A0A9R1CW15_9EURY|nr:hypothetical protein [Natronomonas aquatica]MCQ4334611.1 hypothetical protein [Natronomonas aquatica]
MIWTGQPGQLATTYVLLLVPAGLWQSIAIGLETNGLDPELATAIATAFTVGWLAVILTPRVRLAVIRCIFPDERPGREWHPDGGHDLRRVSARVRDRVTGVVGA